MSRMFDGGSRYDVLGLWPTLNGIDEQTMISREVTDEEVLNYSRGLNGRQDPDGTHLLRKFRTNHLLSKLTHGAQQMGMSRDTFNPTTYVNRKHPQQMHLGCYSVLSGLIAKVTGDQIFAILKQPPQGPFDYPYIDPVGVMMINGLATTTTTVHRDAHQL